MVIGNGLMAKTFSDYDTIEEILIFASGVSNSTETRQSEFEREFVLLKNTIKQHPNLMLVYFSTLSVLDKSVSDRLYIKHKLEIENYIKKNTKNYLIARVSNVVGPGGNDKTIINYLVNAIKNNEVINVWSRAERNLIDQDDVKYIIDAYIRKNTNKKTVSVATNFNIKINDIVNQIEKKTNKKAKIIVLDKGNSLNFDLSDINYELSLIENKKGKGLDYLNYILEKYY